MVLLFYWTTACSFSRPSQAYSPSRCLHPETSPALKY